MLQIPQTTTLFSRLSRTWLPTPTPSFSRQFFTRPLRLSLPQPCSKKVASWAVVAVACGAGAGVFAFQRQPQCDSVADWQTVKSVKIVGKSDLDSPANSPLKVSRVNSEKGSLAVYLWQHLKGEWLLITCIVGLAVTTAFVNLQLPVILGKLTSGIQKVLAVKSASGILQLSVLARPAAQLGVLYAIQGVLTFATISLASVLGERLAVSLRLELFRSLLYQDMAFFDGRMQGDLLTRLTDCVSEFKHSFKLLSTQGVKASIQILGSTVQLLQLSTPLALRMAAAAPVIYLCLSSYGSFLRRLSRDAKMAEALAVNRITESLSNVRTAKSYVAEDRELTDYATALREACVKQNRLGLHIGAFQGISNFSIGGVVLTILYYGGQLVGRGDLSAGQLMAFLVTTQAAQRSFSTMGSLLGTFSRAMDSLASVHEYAVEVSPTIRVCEGLIPTQFRGAIEFREVSFSYPTRPDHPVLEDLNLVIPQGKVTALCAQSGTGKTTIGQLIERFYDPTSGMILLDGLPLTHLSPKFVRENVGYIDQNPSLFATTIYENIKYGNPNATEQQVIDAARRANVLEFASKLPNGLDTVVGERGVQMSGGMKQRIVIARAILKDPAFLILDEATSSLDSHSEALVQQSLQELMKNRTVLVIAHRLGTIINADNIVVLGARDAGKGAQVLECGTHAQLIKKKGFYYRFYQLQDGIRL